MSKTSEDPVAITIATYDNIAEKHQEKYTDIDKFGDLTNYFIAQLPGDNILDAGCGSGRHAAHFYSKGFKVTAIDLSKRMLELTKIACPNCTVSKSDIRTLKYPAENFDGIWAMMSLLHLPRPDASKTLKGFYRVLKPGGILYVSVKAGEKEKYITKDYYSGHKKFFCYYSPEELKKLVVNAGFIHKMTLLGHGIVNEEVVIDLFAQKPLSHP